MKCTAVLHEGVCHRTSTQQKVGKDEEEEEEDSDVSPSSSIRAI